MTKNGYRDLVVVSIGTYRPALVEVYQKLVEAEKQIADGVPLVDGEEVLQNLRVKYAKA